MAKESMKAREVKRAKLVAKYAAKRAALKKIIATGEPEEAYEAARSGKCKSHSSAQPLQDYGPSARIHPSVRHLPYPVPRNGFCRSHSGSEEGKLVIHHKNHPFY